MKYNPRNNTVTYTRTELSNVQESLERIRDEAIQEGKTLQASLVVEMADYLNLHLKPITRKR